MEGRNTGWLRVRGIGRERLARYVAEFLGGAGYKVEETNDASAGTVASRLVAELVRPNPAVPSSLHRLEFRTSPTAGGSLLRWEVPAELAQPSEKARAVRFATELSSNLEQRVALESRGAGKITKEQAQPPFLPSLAPPSQPKETEAGRTPHGGAEPARGSPAPADSSL